MSGRNSLELTDEQYLEWSELSIFVRHLFMQAAIVKPDDSVDFAEKYFRRIQSCRNVLGADYLFITSCRQNRRSFVFCVCELYRSIALEEELTTSDYHQVIEMICPDFPRSAVEEAAACLTPSSTAVAGVSISSSSSSGNPQQQPLRKYRHSDLRASLAFHLIYEGWLRRLRWGSSSSSSALEGGGEAMNLFRVRAMIEDLRAQQGGGCSKGGYGVDSSSGSSPATSIYFEHPPFEGVDAVLTSLSASSNEVKFDALKRALISNKTLREEALRAPKFAQPLLSGAELQPTMPEPPPHHIHIAEEAKSLPVGASTGAIKGKGKGSDGEHDEDDDDDDDDDDDNT